MFCLEELPEMRDKHWCHHYQHPVSLVSIPLLFLAALDALLLLLVLAVLDSTYVGLQRRAPCMGEQACACMYT